MRRAISVHSAQTWPETALIGTVTLRFEDRYRRRFRMTDDAGVPFLLDIERAVILSDGDGLAIEGGGFVRVCAAAEPVLDIRCRSRIHAANVAWHLGNRHAPIQIMDDGSMRTIDDHVLADMLTGLGANVYRHQAPFAPEPGAYTPGGHDHVRSSNR
ncbi:MAG: urease accessory protein UreE [Rhodospirillales bacterium]|nr:urease accessory protein UreE [Rhodospirillales bacterium]